MHREWSRVVRRVAVAASAATLGVLAALIVPSAPAYAADTLVKTSPKAGATLDTAPRQIALTFSGKPQEDGTEVQVTGPDGKQAVSGDAKFQDTSVIVGFDPTAVGEYKVDWKATSADGETASGSWGFNLTSTTPPAGAAQAANTTGAGAGTGRVTISPLTQLLSTPWWVWVGVGAAVVIAAVAIIGNQTAQSAQLARRGRHEPRPGRFPNVDTIA
jgi:methionine-rich copper-binding protein CopC